MSSPTRTPLSARGALPTRLCLLGAAVVTLALGYGHARVLRQSVEHLLLIVPDDAFYYLQTARHLAAGDGSTFDGLNANSGYHPGWMLLLVPLARIVPASAALLRSALALEFVLHAGTGVALALFFRRHMSPAAAWIGGLCWLANPFAILLSLQGVESALYALSLVLFLTAAARFSGVDGDPGANRVESFRSAARPGLLLAACFLARTEAGILAASACAVLPLLSIGWNRRALQAAFRMGAAFTLGIAPWFAYCWVATGSPWQSSGVMKALWGARELAHLGLGGRVASVAAYLRDFWLATPWVITPESPFTGTGIFFWLATAPAMLALALAGRHGEEGRRLLRWLAWLLASTVATGVVYGLLYADTQVWHRTQPTVVIFVSVWLGLARGGSVLLSRWRSIFTIAIPAALLVASLLESYSFYANPPVIYPWQPEVYVSQPKFERLVPPHETIGCFNAGIPAFFSARRIVNLDGLANVAVVPYYQAGNVEHYLAGAGIRYIADQDDSLQRARSFMRVPPRLRQLASVPLGGWLASERSLWVIDAEQPPPTDPRQP